MRAVSLRYALPDWTPEAHRVHKQADVVAAASEAVHCTGWSRDEVRDVLRIEFPVLDVDPLQAIYGGMAWEPWASGVAASRFLAELKRLTKAR